jgi:mlo protein
MIYLTTLIPMFYPNFISLLVKMGSSFKKAIFDDNVTEGLANWAERARRRTIISSKTTVNVSDPPVDEANDAAVQMTNTHAISSDEQGTSLT